MVATAAKGHVEMVFVDLAAAVAVAAAAAAAVAAGEDLSMMWSVTRDPRSTRFPDDIKADDVQYSKC